VLVDAPGPKEIHRVVSVEVENARQQAIRWLKIDHARRRDVTRCQVRLDLEDRAVADNESGIVDGRVTHTIENEPATKDNVAWLHEEGGRALLDPRFGRPGRTGQEDRTGEQHR
jgi:hypothetical protein